MSAKVSLCGYLSFHLGKEIVASLRILNNAMIKYFYVFEIEEDAKKNRRKRWMVHSLASTDSEEWHAKNHQ